MKYVLWLLLGFSVAAESLTVPFYNINLTPNQAININYSFAPYSMIFCWESSSLSPVNLNWPYHGTRSTILLPASLITNTLYQGSLADPTGFITIQNGTHGQVNVNCQFGF